MKYSSPQEFHSWFSEYPLDVVRCSTLYPVHERSGLVSPPEPFYTNAVESKNNILKQHLERKSSTLPDFVDSTSWSASSVKRLKWWLLRWESIVRYHKYSHLLYEHTKWFTMSPKQRQAQVSQFMKYTVEEGNATATCCSRVDINTLAGCGLPSHVANTIWKCANSPVQQSSRALVIALPLWLRASVASVHTMSRQQRICL